MDFPNHIWEMLLVISSVTNLWELNKFTLFIKFPEIVYVNICNTYQITYMCSLEN